MGARGPGRSQDYVKYMRSAAWKTKRRERMELDRYTCQACGFRKRLTVHHLTYERLGNEEMADLLTLCGRCHGIHHGVAEIRSNTKERKARKRRLKRAVAKTRGAERSRRRREGNWQRKKNAEVQGTPDFRDTIRASLRRA